MLLGRGTWEEGREVAMPTVQCVHFHTHVTVTDRQLFANFREQ